MDKGTKDVWIIPAVVISRPAWPSILRMSSTPQENSVPSLNQPANNSCWSYSWKRRVDGLFLQCARLQLFNVPTSATQEMSKGLWKCDIPPGLLLCLGKVKRVFFTTYNQSIFARVSWWLHDFWNVFSQSSIPSARSFYYSPNSVIKIDPCRFYCHNSCFFVALNRPADSIYRIGGL